MDRKAKHKEKMVGMVKFGGPARAKSPGGSGRTRGRQRGG